MSDVTEYDHVVPFESATELREAHARLLETYSQQLGQDAETKSEAAALQGIETSIRGFLARATATGAFLENVKDRNVAQGFLDYWVSSLSHSGFQTSRTRLATFDELLLPDLKDKPCPYVGLEAFRENTYFFGREEDTQELLTRIRATPLVIVFGASGSGKSSLVIGGVLPALRAQKEPPALQIIPPFVPGKAVLSCLVVSVRNVLKEPASDVATEADQLLNDATRLSAMLGGAYAPPTVITIDQFEEVFTLSKPDDQVALVKNLAQVLEAGRGHRIILTMRQEFESRVRELKALSPYFDRARYSMRPMGYEELCEAVKGPAAVVNLQFQLGIVEDIVKKVLGQPAALPLLQFTLRELWDKRDRNRITWEVYDQVGDPLSALERSAERFFEGLVKETQDEAQRILLELVKVSELLEAYRQPVFRTELLKAGKANTKDVIDSLERGGYVRVTPPGARKEDAVVEVKHEALIRNWPRYRTWIDDKRYDQRRVLAIKQAAERWLKAGKPRRGLLTGWQLETAKTLQDLGPGETEFVHASGLLIKRRERLFRFGVAFVIGALIFGLLLGAILEEFYFPEQRETSDKIASLLQKTPAERKLYAESVLDEVAIYFWERNKTDKKAGSKLIKLLKYADSQGLFKPEEYQVTAWKAVSEFSKRARRQQTESSLGDETLVTIGLGPRGVESLDPAQVEIAWQDIAGMLSVSEQEIPIPTQIQVKNGGDGPAPYNLTVQGLEFQVEKTRQNAASTEPRPQSPKQFEAPRGEFKLGRAPKLFELAVTLDPSTIFLPEGSLNQHQSTKEFFEYHKEKLDAKKAFQNLGPLARDPSSSVWWSFPRWTIPIWKAAGVEPRPPETSIAVAGLVELETHPNVLMSSDESIARILRMDIFSKPLVKAACKAAGGVPQLTKEIVGWLSERDAPNSLARLPYKLEDMVQKNPAAVSSGCDNIPKDLSLGLGADEHGLGADEHGLGADELSNDELKGLIKQIDHLVQGSFKLDPPLRVVVAKTLVDNLALHGHLDDENQRFSSWFSKMERTLGVHLFVEFRVDPALETNHFRVGIGDEHDTEITVAAGRETDDILSTLEEQINRRRPAFLGIDETKSLVDNLPQEIRDWLVSSYRIGELELIFREALAENGSAYKDLNPNDVSEVRRSEETLVHLADIVPSLAFWKHVCEPQGYKCLGEKLRKTRARLLGRETGTPAAPLHKTPGMTFLNSRQFTEAERQFADELKTSSRELKEKTFLEAYPELAMPFEYSELVDVCTPKPGSYAYREADVRDARDRIASLLQKFAGASTGSKRRVLDHCSIWSQALDEPLNEASLESIDRMLQSNTSGWTLVEKHWLAYLALKTHLASTRANDKAPPAKLEAVERLLSEATRSLPLDQAEVGFEEIAPLCFGLSAGAWCGQVLGRAAQQRLDSYWIPFRFAWESWLSGRLSRQSAQAALNFLELAQSNLHRVEPSRQQQQAAWLSFARGAIYLTLAKHGASDDREKAIDLFRNVAKSKQIDQGPSIDMVYEQLAFALLQKGLPDEAALAIAEGSKHNKESTSLRIIKAQVAFARGQFDESVKILEGKTEKSAQLMRIFGLIGGQGSSQAEPLKREVDNYLQTSADDRDYVRLIYYWWLMREQKSSAAQQLLEDRWREIDPASWQARLGAERGDYRAVWEEKLIGYYLGKVSEKEVSETIEDPAHFAASPFARAGMSRNGFLCEWRFYDALLQSVTGDRATRRARMLERLQKVIETQYVTFIEYNLAQDLVRRMDRGEDISLGP